MRVGLFIGARVVRSRRLDGGCAVSTSIRPEDVATPFANASRFIRAYPSRQFDLSDTITVSVELQATRASCSAMTFTTLRARCTTSTSAKTSKAPSVMATSCCVTTIVFQCPTPSSSRMHLNRDVQRPCMHIQPTSNHAHCFLVTASYRL